MIILLNKNSLYNTFGVETFNSLESAVNNMAPSLVEYHLSDLSQYSEDTYLNRSQIEQTFYIGDYSLYIDYSDNIYLELSNDDANINGTSSLW